MRMRHELCLIGVGVVVGGGVGIGVEIWKAETSVCWGLWGLPRHVWVVVDGVPAMQT